eukprot:3759896-Pyramimonas_sp.AAC.1
MPSNVPPLRFRARSSMTDPSTPVSLTTKRSERALLRNCAGPFASVSYSISTSSAPAQPLCEAKGLVLHRISQWTCPLPRA